MALRHGPDRPGEASVNLPIDLDALERYLTDYEWSDSSRMLALKAMSAGGLSYDTTKCLLALIDATPTLITELRAARKVVDAARALIGRIDGQPRSRLEVEPFHGLVDALAELEALK